ncbi:MAG: hypothetical protein II896_06290 [Clostridia bacterium]|nr:hypothetical protein [Clostridia bacterium]
MNPHDGHRERLRAKIRKDGLNSLEPHEVLEYFLYPFVPRRNTNDIAHALLHKFGSLSGVLEADCAALADVDGMTANAALFLSQLPAFLVMYKMDKATKKNNFLAPAEAAVYLNELIGQRPTECFAALALDVKGNLIGTVQFESTRADSVAVDVRKLVKELLLIRATGVIVAHNHPSGDVTPSMEDGDMLELLRSAFAPLDINLLDCLIVGGGKAVSMMRRQAAKGTDTRVPWEIDAGVPTEEEYNLLFNRNDKN